MNYKSKKNGGFVLLAFLMLLLFNAPILNVPNKGGFTKGIPNLYLYLFTSWLLGILLLVIITHSRKRKSGKKHE